MSPQIALLIAKMFMNSKGKPNKILSKLGKDTLGDILESTFKDGKPTMETLDAIKQLNGGKTPRATKEMKEAQKFLKEGGAKKDMGSYVLQDVIMPALSGATRTVGNVAALQQQVPAMALQAAADRMQVNPAVAQNTAGGKLLSMAMPMSAAAQSGIAAARGALASGIANTAADTIDHATNVARVNDELARQMQNTQAFQAAQSEPLKASQWDYMSEQLRQQGKKFAGGRA